MNRSVTILAPAKINLYLKILGQRSDGYHDIHSLIQAIDLYDTVVVTRTESGISMNCDDPKLPADSSNLAWKAADLMLQKAKVSGGVAISLAKRIPYGAGLGGGSSDAAAVMKAINRIYGLNLGWQRLAEWSSELGSDMPFFFSNGTAIVSGRGEIVTSVEVLQSCFVLLIVPGFRISTKDAYQGLRLYLTKFSVMSDINLKTSGSEFFKTLYKLGNDFQRMVMADHPEIGSCISVLQRGGASYVALSGSGSAFFGLFEREIDTELVKVVSSQFGWQVYSLKPVRLAQN